MRIFRAQPIRQRATGLGIFRALIVAVSLALLATACGTQAGDSPTASGGAVADVGASLGEIETSRGGTFEFASLDNKPTVVWFWGPG